MNKFIYGASYYPLNHPESEWEQDLKIMKESGINLIRTAEIFNTWDVVEAKEGVFNFEFLDKFFDLCGEYDLKILLGTGTASPPIWLHQKHPEVNITSSNGSQYPVNASYTWACIDNEIYLEKASLYLKKLVERYKKHKALGAYQIHNEIGFPFMATASGEMENYCFCEDSKKSFIKWVKEKYKTLDALNEAWRWSATNQVHTDWNEIEPPKVKPKGWSSVTRWLDWKLFWMDNFVRFVKWQNDLIKKEDTKHPTSTNIFFMKSQDMFGVMMGLDQFKMAKVVDYIGYDLYPGSGNKLEKKPEYTSMFFDHARSISKPLNKNYWLMEAESGPINGWILGPDRNTNDDDIEKNAFEAIGKDAKFILYQLWREPRFQPLHWGGIVGLDGSKTSRVDACKRVATFIDDNHDFIMGSNTLKGEVALLISRENFIITNGMGQDKFLEKSLRGSYKLLWEMGYRIDFVTPELLKEGYGKDYKAILTPFMASIDEETAKTLDEYVRGGGVLISGARTGMLDEKGWFNYSMPCGSLADTFGIKVDTKDLVSNVNPKVSFSRREYIGHWHAEKIDVISSSVKVVGRYHSDRPVVTVNKYHEGKAIYMGTHGDVAYLEGSDLLLDIIETYVERPEILLNYSNRDNREIDLHRLVDEDKEMLVLTNYIPKGKTFFVNGNKLVELNIKSETKPKEIKDYHSKKSLAYSYIDGYVNISYEVKEGRSSVIELFK